MGNIGWKLTKAGATMAAGFLAERLISAAWKSATGNKPPEDPENPETKLGQAVTYAAISAAVVAVVRVFATRAAGKAYMKSVEGPAPWLEEDAL